MEKWYRNSLLLVPLVVFLLCTVFALPSTAAASGISESEIPVPPLLPDDISIEQDDDPVVVVFGNGTATSSDLIPAADSTDLVLAESTDLVGQETGMKKTQKFDSNSTSQKSRRQEWRYKTYFRTSLFPFFFRN